MRNQLAVLTGYAGLLDNAKIEEDRARILQKIHHAIMMLQGQIDFTKNFQDIGTGEPTWQDLHSLVQKARLHLAHSELAIIEAGTNVEIRVDPLFEKVVFNLIDNVLRHGGGARHLRISAEENAGLRLIFEDDGRGISDEDRAHLFERGYGKNTGFGLFLSREMLGMTDMTISETSVPGSGARFEIVVPKGSYRISGK
jgi:signal transduction histidine kinase